MHVPRLGVALLAVFLLLCAGAGVRRLEPNELRAGQVTAQAEGVGVVRQATRLSRAKSRASSRPTATAVVALARPPLPVPATLEAPAPQVVGVDARRRRRRLVLGGHGRLGAG